MEKLDKTTFGVVISSEKTNYMANNTQNIGSEIKISGAKLVTGKTFNYHDSIISVESSKTEIAQTTAKDLKPSKETRTSVCIPKSICCAPLP